MEVEKYHNFAVNGIFVHNSQEDQQGKPFVGASGQYLERIMREEAGVDFREDCWIYNSVICRPKDNKTPEAAVDFCRPNAVNIVNDLKPKTVILLGSGAVKSVLGWLWKEDAGGVERWAGFQIPNQKINAWICPVFHPAYVLRQKEKCPAAELWFRKYIKAALRLRERPPVTDYVSGLRTFLVPDKECIELVRKMAASKVPVAFDYETTTLKPEDNGAGIYSISFSDGVTTFAAPWCGTEFLAAVKDFLRSPVPKIASNMKFEMRWSKAHVGVWVRNLNFDTMLAAHIADNRPGICSIKFQAFALLGVDAWDDHVKPFLKGREGKPNRVKDCDLTALLKYNALDSLYEWHVARRQKELMEIE